MPITDFWRSVLKEKARYLDFKGFVDYSLFAFKAFDGFIYWFQDEFRTEDFNIVVPMDGHFFIDLTQFKKLYNSFNSASI